MKAIVSCISSLVELMSGFPNRHETEGLELQVPENSSRVLRDEHPDTLVAMGNLAFTLKS